MKATFAAALVFALGLVAPVCAQYGLMENYEGADRFGGNINLTEGVNFLYGGASGGGEGAGAVISGTSGFGWGTGLPFSDGFGIQVRAAGVNNGPDVLDLTASVNGLTSTGYTISLRDVDADGVGGVDVFQFVVEDDTATTPGQEIFEITGLTLNTPTTLTFLPGDGVAGPGGLPDRSRFKQFIIRASTVTGTGANLNVDNIGFTGNLVPTSYDIEDFDAFALGNLGTGGRAGSVNVFGGNIESFGFGSNVTSATLVNLGAGDQALEMSFDGIQAGFLFELGPVTGSQIDVSAAEGLSLDLATAEPGQEVQIIVETIDATTFGNRCQTIVTPGTTLSQVQIPFSSLTCGAQGFTADAVHRVTILPVNADTGSPGISITVNNLSFYTTSSVTDWNEL